MATKNPRAMVVLEPPLYQMVTRMARTEGVSISTKIRDLIRDACEMYEDAYWAKEGEKRLAGFNRGKALGYRQLTKRLGISE